MQTHSPARAPLAAPPISAWRRWVRRGYLFAAALVGAAVVAQVFLAGAGVLVDPAYWGAHRSFGHTIELLLFVLLPLGLATRLPWRVQGLGLLLLALMILQYVFLYLMPAVGLPLLRALHAVNALAMFSLALLLALRVRRALRGRDAGS